MYAVCRESLQDQKDYWLERALRGGGEAPETLMIPMLLPIMGNSLLKYPAANVV